PADLREDAARRRRGLRQGRGVLRPLGRPRRPPRPVRADRALLHLGARGHRAHVAGRLHRVHDARVAGLERHLDRPRLRLRPGARAGARAVERRALQARRRRAPRAAGVVRGRAAASQRPSPSRGGPAGRRLSAPPSARVLDVTHVALPRFPRLRPMAAEPAPISFARGAPSLDIIDVEGLKAAAERAFTEDPSGTFASGMSVGYLPLRAWIAERHGVAENPVPVTNGSMQADAFLFSTLVSAGDVVVVERPSYDRTLGSLRSLGADLHAVDVEPDGVSVDGVRQLLDSGVSPRLAHLIPNFHNPAGY